MYGPVYLAPPVPLVGTLVVIHYDDLNKNAMRDTAEIGLLGSFSVLHNGAPTAVITTDPTGTVSLTLAPGTYAVRESLESGWYSIDPGGMTPTKTVTIVAGQTTTVSFGCARVLIPSTSQGVRIQVRTYEDRDHDGSLDTGEPGLAGWTFSVFDSQGATVAGVTTDAQGSATTIALAPGAYTIVQQPQAGWFNTDPGTASASKQTLLVSEPVTVIFGNARVELPSTSTDPADDGAPGSSTVLFLTLAVVSVALRRAIG